MIYFKRLKVQISCFYLLASLISMAIFSSMLYYRISDILMKDAISKTTLAIEQSSDTIGNYINKVKGISKILAESPSLQLYLEENYEREKQNIQKQIATILETDDHIESVTIVAKDGRLISSKEQFDMSMSGNMMKEEWYLKSIENNMPVLTGGRMQTLFGDQDNWVISLSREVVDEQGTNLGVLLIDIRYCVIGDYMKNLDLGEQGYIYMLSKQDELIYHEDTTYFSDVDKQQQLRSIFQGGNRYNKKSGQLVYQTAVEHTNWILVGVPSLDNLSILKQQLFLIIMIVGCLIFLGILVSGTFFARRISKPLTALEHSMDEIENLKEVVVDQKGFYEITLLAKNYNKMLAKIKELMRELSEKEKQLGRLEIHTLISQINPHFLYNTLDTIVWMAEFNESSRVIDMTKALARFFRLSLNGGKEFVTIEEEIEHIRQYLYIQKVRYEEKLEYTITVEEAVLKESIPKIILQPIIENSIYHGIKPLEGKGHIWIEVCGRKDEILLTIVDNGVGFDESSEKNDQGPRLGGIGIKNVDKRIHLYYGEDYGITMNSKLGEGCRTEIVLKKRYTD